MLSVGRHGPCGTGSTGQPPQLRQHWEKGKTLMDNSLSAASNFYAEPPLSPAPAFGGEVHIPSHVPEFSPIPARPSLSPVVEVPRVEAAPVPAPEPTPAPAAAAADEAEEPKAPSLERMLLKFG